MIVEQEKTGRMGQVVDGGWVKFLPVVTIKELKRLGLGYLLEIKASYTTKIPCKDPKLTPKGKLAKNQFDFVSLTEFFKTISSYVQAGFPANLETGQGEKILIVTDFGEGAF